MSKVEQTRMDNGGCWESEPLGVKCPPAHGTRPSVELLVILNQALFSIEGSSSIFFMLV